MATVPPHHTTAVRSLDADTSLLAFCKNPPAARCGQPACMRATLVCPTDGDVWTNCGGGASRTGNGSCPLFVCVKGRMLRCASTAACCFWCCFAVAWRPVCSRQSLATLPQHVRASYGMPCWSSRYKVLARQGKPRLAYHAGIWARDFGTTGRPVLARAGTAVPNIYISYTMSRVPESTWSTLSVWYSLQSERRRPDCSVVTAGLNK